MFFSSCHVMVLTVPYHDNGLFVVMILPCHGHFLSWSCHVFVSIMAMVLSCHGPFHVMMISLSWQWPLSCHGHDLVMPRFLVMSWLWHAIVMASINIMITALSFYRHGLVMSWSWPCHILVLSCHGDDLHGHSLVWSLLMKQYKPVEAILTSWKSLSGFTEFFWQPFCSDESWYIVTLVVNYHFYP